MSWATRMRFAAAGMSACTGIISFFTTGLGTGFAFLAISVPILWLAGYSMLDDQHEERRTRG